MFFQAQVDSEAHLAIPFWLNSISTMVNQAQFYSDTLAFPPAQPEYVIYDWHGLNESNGELQRGGQNLQRNHHLLGEVGTLGCTSSFNQGKTDLDIGQCICIHGERLRAVLLEQQKRQTEAFLGKLECRVIHSLKQKDEQIAQVVKRRIQLQDLLRGLEEERQSWQKVAEENEAMAVYLSSHLAEVKEKSCNTLSRETDDAQSETGDTKGEQGRVTRFPS